MATGKTSFRSWDAADKKASQMYRTGRYHDVQVKKVLDSSRQGHHWSIKTVAKNPKVSLPKKWTSAQVRVNRGKVQVKINPGKLIGFTKRLESLRKRLYTAELSAAKANTFAKRIKAKTTMRKIQDQIARLSSKGGRGFV